jgi:nitrate reductase NapAB chaperone NapD
MNVVHVASLIVRTDAAIAPEVAARLALEPRTEVHAVQDGKIIVVVESAGERELADRMDEIRADADVLLVNLVYHESAMEEDLA